MAAEHDDHRARAHLHGMWVGVAGSWGEHADYIDRRACAASTGELLRRSGAAAGRAGARAGVRARAASGSRPRALVQPGEVVLSDVAPEMTAIAARAGRGAWASPTCSTCELDLEAIERARRVLRRRALPRRSACSRPIPAARRGEIARVLRPGGRAAVAVWGPRERNPWLGVVFDAVSAQLGTPVPPPGVPGPFSLDDAVRLARPDDGRGSGRRRRRRARRADARRDVRRVVGRGRRRSQARSRSGSGRCPPRRRWRCAAGSRRPCGPSRPRPAWSSPGVTLIASGRRAAP